MKKYGKLLIAFMWLGLTMIMIVGATFAWFSENRQVEANGMSVEAEVANNLLIGNSGVTAGSAADPDGTYAVSATATYTTLNKLRPSSTSKTTGVLDSGKFFYVTNTDTVEYASGNAAATTTFAAATIAADAANQYVSVNTFHITALGDTSKKTENVYVSSVTVLDGESAPDSNISKALRVAVVCENYVYIFAPVSGYSATYYGVKAAGTNGSSTVSSTAEAITTAGTGATIGTLTAGETAGANKLDVTIYVWYEGQDAACTSANSINVETLNVSVKFDCTDWVAAN